MKNYIIPSIVAVAVLLTGVFALLPVENASTVHTTILAGTTQLRAITSVAAGLDIDDGEEMNITCGGVPFIVKALYIAEDATSVGANDDVEFDGAELAQGDGEQQIGNEAGFTTTTAAANADNVTVEFIAAITGTDVEHNLGIVSDGSDLELLVLGTTIDLGARWDTTVLLETSNQAVCAVTMQAED